MNWLRILLFIASLFVAGTGAYFSVTGLGVLFSGATMSVMVMASSLEFAKLVTASYLEQKWSSTSFLLKIYLTIAVFVLMIITSAGIFGYLSNAYQQQNLKLQQVDRELSIYTDKIKQNDAQIAIYNSQISDYNKNQTAILSKGEVNNRLLKSLDSRDGRITDINDKVSQLQSDNSKNVEIINGIKAKNVDIEREVGGFRFIAESFGIELNVVVKWFIILIVLVFDPLAIAMVIALNKLYQEKEPVIESHESADEYEIYKDADANLVNNQSEFIEQPVVEESIIEPVIEQITEPVIESVELESPIRTKRKYTWKSPLKNTIRKPRAKKIDKKKRTVKKTTKRIKNDKQDKNEELPIEIETQILPYYLSPEFDWNKRDLWQNDQEAVAYWMKNFNSDYPIDFESKTY
jgi:hypothetical protein